MKNLLWGSLAVVAIGVAFVGARYYQVMSTAAEWDGPVAEILTEKLDKQDNTMEIEFTSRLDAPVATVMQAFSEPERSQEFSDSVRRSKLLHHKGNRKVIELEMVVLGRPQESTMAFTFLPEENRVLLETVENQLTDLRGEYRFTPSPDGTKTLLTYSVSATDKTQMPVPLALQKSAMREAFVSTLRALKKGLAVQAQAQS